MSLKIVPSVGSAGFYEFAAPFDTKALATVEYSCKAVRKISEYLASGEDVKKDIYDENGLTDAIYEEDLAQDAYIVSLQSGTGHWLYVPYRYILSFPSTNGVPYRSVMLGFSLPALPAGYDLSPLLGELKLLIESRLGVQTSAKMVETSKVSLIPKDAHVTKQAERNARKAGDLSIYATQVRLEREAVQLRTKVAELEAYIKAHA